MFEDNFQPISPLPLFQIQLQCFYIDPEDAEKNIKKTLYALPTTEKLTLEAPFASMYMGWNEMGLWFFADVKSPFSDVFYPDISRGDSVELFIDTRDVKTTGFATKFTHHFFFLPQEIDGHKAGEITRFRSEDAHDLCNPKDLHLKAKIEKNGYFLSIFIPSQCLYGYDPEQFGRIGFTYRINRLGKPGQHFSVLSQEFKIEQQPSLWSSVQLVKENGPIRKTSKFKS